MPFQDFCGFTTKLGFCPELRLFSSPKLDPTRIFGIADKSNRNSRQIPLSSFDLA